MSQSTEIKTFALLCALLMVGAAFVPVAVLAEEHNVPANLSVEQHDDRSVTISVTNVDGEPVPDTNVSVEENDTEEDASDLEILGDYTTNESGIVELEPPSRTVTVDVTAEVPEDDDLVETVTLEGPGLALTIEQRADASTLVTVTNDSAPAEGAAVTVAETEDEPAYAGSGEYDADENGHVSLPAPEETVHVNITAEYEEQSASKEVTLYNRSEIGNESFVPFGQQVSSFVHSLQEEDIEGIGPHVAAFVTAHNPGNAPDHAGPPAWLTDEDVEKSPGPPAHAGPDGDDERRGPPDHAGPNANDGDDDDDDDDDDDNSRGPPDHAGPP